MKCAALIAFGIAAVAQGQELGLMPMPKKIQMGEGLLPIDAGFSIETRGVEDARVTHAIERLQGRLSQATGIPLNFANRSGKPAALVVESQHAGAAVQKLGEDESYTLEISPTQARLTAPNALGILRGLETFLQLVHSSSNGFAAPALSISDSPRFPWRGLHMDVSRHFMPLDIVLRNLDAMAAVKLNVFHWHLSDDQGFRVESKRYPKLHERGSDGQYYTQDQIRQVVAYARDRGIRVVPEFDVPAHSAAWLAGYPELGSVPGPYQIERTWGILEPTMDPTKESTYTFLDNFIGEMAPLFPDDFFHIGGDEVNGKQWNTSAHIVAYKQREGLANNDALQAQFNRRMQAIVRKHGKRMEGWDEILNPDLQRNIVIQSWRGLKSLAEAARLGYSGLLSTP
ncbi:MAG: family 20 glycosylhydrolase, partial [Acidobacteriaceae bacterium]|nr:family 20 glycosylhydrolase [Acidobacteriaceae bacterium]